MRLLLFGMLQCAFANYKNIDIQINNKIKHLLLAFHNLDDLVIQAYEFLKCNLT